MSGGVKTTAKPKLDINRTREQLMARGCGHTADQLGDVLVLGGCQGQRMSKYGTGCV